MDNLHDFSFPKYTMYVIYNVFYISAADTATGIIGQPKYNCAIPHFIENFPLLLKRLIIINYKWIWI
jgi:hypothetical protein